MTKVLPILSVAADGILRLSPGAAMAIINGKEIHGWQVVAKIVQVVTDEKGEPVLSGDGAQFKLEVISDHLLSVEIGYRPPTRDEKKWWLDDYSYRYGKIDRSMPPEKKNYKSKSKSSTSATINQSMPDTTTWITQTMAWESEIARA